MTKLKDCVECINEQTFVLLKVKDGMEMDMIMTGLFEGDETMFRITKGDDHNCTTWYKNGKNWSWHHGLNGHTCVANSVWAAWREIERTITEDFGIKL